MQPQPKTHGIVMFTRVLLSYFCCCYCTTFDVYQLTLIEPDFGLLTAVSYLLLPSIMAKREYEGWLFASFSSHFLCGPMYVVESFPIFGQIIGMKKKYIFASPADALTYILLLPLLELSPPFLFPLWKNPR